MSGNLLYMNYKNKYINKSRELEIQNIKNGMQKSYYEKIDQSNKEYLKLIHNIHHYLGVIGALTLQGQSDEVIKLLDEVETKMGKINKIVYCRHIIFNSLLSEKHELANNHNISMEINIEPDVQLNFISNFDLIAMMGNLLDNAIEAAGKCNYKKRISINAFMANNARFVYFSIINTYNEKIVIQSDRILSSKNEKEYHGIGIKNVKEIAEKYGGYLEIEFDKEVFNASLILSTYNGANKELCTAD